MEDEKRAKYDAPIDKTFAVKIHTTAVEYDYKYPWKAPTIKRWTGSGFVVNGKKIITNAHVAGGAIFMEVELANDSCKYPASLEVIGHDCDLAILSVKDEEFWQKAEPVAIGDTPKRQDKVEVHGFPMGGEEYCITDGIVSRSENGFYVHGERELVATQVSAAINSGNSGGAVLSNGKVVGVVHQGMTRGQNIGYMVPAGVLKHFINQAETLEMGFPGLDIETQKMGNKHLRDEYSMKKGQTGVLVTAVADLSCAKGRLQKGDVILAIDKIPINNDGTVHVDQIKRIDYRFLINSRHMGEELDFKVLRDGEVVDEKVKLTNTMGDTSVIGPLEFGKPPTYFIIGGGIVVQPVNKNYVYDTKQRFEDTQKHQPNDQLIAINTILKSEHTQDYDNFAGDLIKSINGKSIHNIQDVIKAVEENTKKTHRIRTSSGRLIAIPNLDAKERQAILDVYHIPSEKSVDLETEEEKLEDVLSQMLSEKDSKTPLFNESEKSSDSSESAPILFSPKPLKPAPKPAMPKVPDELPPRPKSASLLM